MRLTTHKGPVMISVNAASRDAARNGDVTLIGIYEGNNDITDAVAALTDIDKVVCQFDWEQIYSETMADILEYQKADV